MTTKQEDSQDAPRARRAWVALLSGAIVTAFLQPGCNTTASTAVNAPGQTSARRDTTIKHEACDTSSSSAEKTDVNGDGKPDIVLVRDGGRVVCRAVDLNFDGVIDSYSYFDASGQVRRRENDYDRDGLPDEVIVYQAGAVVEKDQSTALARRFDTWDFYQAGTLLRTERDSDGDGFVDQWWEYPKPGCPLMHADVNGDGQPDPGATIDYCKETGYVPPERSAEKATVSPTFEQKGTLPTELSNKEAPEGSKDAPKTTDTAPKATDAKGSGK
jgi:hypothetical protein